MFATRLIVENNLEISALNLLLYSGHRLIPRLYNFWLGNFGHDMSIVKIRFIQETASLNKNFK